MKLNAEDRATIREVLGYLNFSGGRPDPKFQQMLNSVSRRVPWRRLAETLRKNLTELQGAGGPFADTTQARTVLDLTLDGLFPAYRQHHRDLLFHRKDEDFENPFFLARLFEAALQEGGPWTEAERIIPAALRRLNDFVGHRPVAVLENGRKMEPYPHERLRPIPLFLKGAGVANGPYEAVISGALKLLAETPQEILVESWFDLDRLDELAMDPRSHDHLHPANKRTNYLFGEWDPHLIDLKGFYRRFVVREIILQSLLAWIADQRRTPMEERIFDASAVLAGTILMASSISGAGPETHDSSVTLTSLLPRVARQRDAFYERLLTTATGARTKRLRKHAEATQQPFGHVRQSLNIHLANYGSLQVQRRHLAYLFARLGNTTEAQFQANVIPCASARFESEIQWRLSVVPQRLKQGEVGQAAELVAEAENYLKRGIDCGAIVDPWNVLGFQGQFPLFSSREDSVPDQRVETLLALVESLLRAYSRTLEEAAARGDATLSSNVSRQFAAFADYWDRFGTPTVQDLPAVKARETFDSASHVARALAEWRAAGEAAGNISFWRQHVTHFASAKSYAQVVVALMDRKDSVASLGLLMQWLSQSDEVGLDGGSDSFDGLLLRWMEQLVAGAAENPEAWPLVRRMFDYLEANAGEYWNAPSLQHALGRTGGRDVDWSDDVADDGDSDDEDDVFNAAYDNVVYKDSTADGVVGDTLDSGPAGSSGDGEFELLEKTLEVRLKFVRTMALLLQQGAVLACQAARDADKLESVAEAVTGWLEQANALETGLERLIEDIWNRAVSESSGDHDANVEYDIQLQTKFYLLHVAITTCLSCRTAQWCLTCTLPLEGPARDSARDFVRVLDVYRGILQNDPVEVRRLLPALIRQLQKKPLLYVPLEHGGEPRQILPARTHQVVMRFLLAHLPRLGLLRETWHLLKAAHRMERVSRPAGTAVTEFDRLFRIAMRNSLETIATASLDWKSGRFSDEELIEIVGSVVEFYLDQWLEHSSSMRLSSLEALRLDSVWEETRAFIRKYGSDLLHARMLTLGNIRAILHNGTEKYLNYLDEHEDPLHPLLLLEDLRTGEISREDAVSQLQLIYQMVVEKFDRFLEYNTTTTQSDYGEMFDCLLDFLRLESQYDRDAWNLLPVSLAHEVLSRQGRPEAAEIWEEVFAVKTEDMADRHLQDLERLEKQYGMRLPSVSSHLQERFVKPLAVNRMVASLEPAWRGAQVGNIDTEAMTSLKQTIEAYLHDTTGAGLDVPAWLRTLEEELNRVQGVDDLPRTEVEPNLMLSSAPLTLRDMRQQIRNWRQSLNSRKDSGA